MAKYRKMLEIKQFRYGADNLAYLIYGTETAMAVDGGSVDDIIEFLELKNLELRYVANTHGHSDHLVGNHRLLNETKARFLDSLSLAKTGGVVGIDGENVELLFTPGHSLDSVVFSCGGALLTGDTLFNGTVGNCFSGDLRGFLQSIKRIFEFPHDSRVYAGHDYVGESLAAMGSIEPGNPSISKYARERTGDPLYSTLADEQLVNPFVRLNESSIIDVLREKGLAVATEYDRWKSIMLL